MSEAQAVTGLASTISLLGLVILVFWLYRGYRVDTFRQQMFAIRDELFDFADTSGEIGFDDPAYGMLRRTMNGYIRFGHRLSLLHVLLFAATSKGEAAKLAGHEKSFDSRWRSTTVELSKDSVDRLQAFRNRMERLVLRHIVLNSPLLVALVIPALIGYFLAEVSVSWLSRVLRVELDEIDTAALAYGEI